MLLLVPFWAVQSQGATLYWDSDTAAAGNNATTGAGLGGAGSWDTAALQWWNPIIPGVDVAWNNLSMDTAVFAGTAGAVTLGEAISVGGLTFNTTGYTLTGNTLTLGAALGATSPVISIHQTGSGANRATISSNLAGTSGFTKNGNGTIVLAGASNSYTGDTVINGGSVVISDAGQLGLGTTAISINGVANTGNPGFSGGQLVLNGLSGGITLNREVSISGRGPGAANNSGGLVSIGYNTLAGHLSLGGPAAPASIVATHGITTITGSVQIGNTGNASVFFGNGNYIVSGRVSGFELSADRFVKSGQTLASTLWLQNATNDFAETIRIDSGTVRVSTGSALGVNTSAAGIDLNGGMLEIRTDANGSTFSTRNVNQRANSSVFASRDLAGSAINQTITFGNFSVQTANTNISYLGRDGYNITVGTGTTVAIATGNPWTLNYNNSGTTSLNGAGLLTINNSLSFADGTGRNMSLAIRGDAVLTGNILSPSGGNHNWTKSDTGTLTIQGTAGTMTGAFNITGTVQVTSIGAFNATGVNPVQLNSGAIDYRGVGETRTKLLNLNGTTGNGIILANQAPGSAGLVFNGNPVAAGGQGAKTLFLGGSSEAGIINEIGGVISNSTAATSLSKVGGSTWLYDPAGATYNTVPTGITSNTAAASGTNTNSLTVSSTTGIVVGQGISGTNIPAGSVVTSIVSGTVITISTNIGTAVAASTALTFTANSNFTGNVTVGGGTLQVRPTAGAGNGSDVINNASQIIFGADALTNNGWAGGTFEYQGSAAGGTLIEQVGALTTSAGHGILKVTANGGTPTLNLASLGTRTAGATLNLQPTGGPITFTAAAGTNGILGGYATFGAAGTEFAASVTAGGTATALTGQATLPTSGGVSTTNYQSTGTPAANLSAQSINSLKMVNAQTITLAGTLTLTSGGVLFDNSIDAASIANNGTATNTLGAAASEVIITTNGTGAGNLLTNTLGNPLSVNALISSTTGSLTKAGSGILVVGGANTFTGTVTINEGGLRLGATTATLGVPAAASTLVMRQGTVLDINGAGASGTAYANGPTLNILTVGALNGAGTITSNSATPSAISLGSSATTVATPVFSGIIQDGLGTVSVIKNGTSASAQALTGLNTYTGATVISGGSTIIANSLANGGTPSSIGASTSAAGNLVFNNGILRYQGSNAQIYQTTATPSVSIDRLFTLAGAGTIDSSGQFGNSILAGGNQNNAALIFNNSFNAVAFAGAVGARTLTLQGNSAGDNEMAIQLVESGGYTLGLTKAGTGLWLVTNAANSYSLPTTITGGQLQLNANAGNLPNSSNLRLAGGVLQTSGSFTRAIGTGANQVAFTDAAGTGTNLSGGFSASSAKLTVNLGGANDQLTWGTGGIGNGTGTLILSSATALADVELTNPINFNGANRTVQVDDNGSTGLDYATLSGVLSNSTGTGGLIKTGGGNLILGDANTYNGGTTFSNGAFIVSSIGSAGAASSSFGTNVSGGSVTWNGNASLSLLYVGTGEVTTRPIVFNPVMTAARTYTIDSSGSGPLTLNSITNSQTGAFALTLQLRGTNTDSNVVSSVLGNGANTLIVTKADGGVWSLAPATANTFTGAINANGGLLGLTANGIGAAASVTISNGGIFAYGGDLTSSTNVILANNSTAVFAGQNNITFNGTLTKASGANDQTFSNNLENGKVLTFNGNFINGEGTANATRTINLRGYGSTTFNGVIQNNTTTTTNILRLDIRQANGAVTTLGADNKGSAAGFTGGILLGQGTLRATHTGAFGAAANSLILDGGVVTSTVDLSGANKLVNGVFLQGDPVEFNSATNFELGGVVALNGSRLLLNNLAGGNTLTLSGTIVNSATATFTLAGSGATLINSNYAAGTGTAGLQYSGAGTLTLTAANTLAGAVTLNRGSTTISGTAGSVNAVSGITINPTATLTLDNSVAAGGNNAAGRIAGRAVTLAGGTLNMVSNGTASTETAGVLTVNSVDGNITMSGAGTNTLTFASVSLANTGSSLNLSTISNLGTNNKVIFTTSTGLGAVNNVLPRVFVGGGDFATYNATNGIMAFTGYGAFTNINLAATTDTLKVDGTYTQTNLTASRSINALAINGNGITVGNATTGIPTLTIGSGAVLVNGGSNTLSVPFISLGTNPAIQVTTGAALNITGSIISATSLIKAQGGSLTLSAPQFYTSTTNLVEGTLVLNGGTNTIYPNAQALVVDLNSTLDLNGNIQYVGALTSPGTMPNTGGSITSTPGSGLLVTAGNGTFAGIISGANLNVARVGGNNTWTFESANTYTGSTTVMGGILALENDATLLNTQTINLNYAGLSLNNNSGLQTTNNNRINDAATINLRGGTITFNGRVDDAASETLGAVKALQGASTISSNVGGTGTAGAFTSADLTLASLTRSAGTTVNFNGSSLGSVGNTSHIYITSAPTTQLGGVLGAWAIANSTDYAAYNTGNGVGVVGAGGFTGYDSMFGSGKITYLFAPTAAASTNLTGSNTAALLKIGGAFTNDITFTSPGDSLNLELGGILRSANNNATTIGTTTARGIITSGTNELVIYNASNTTGATVFTINSLIQGATALIKSGAGVLSLTGQNTYSLGTIVNQGTLELRGTNPGDVVIPAGGLTINGGVQGTGAAVTMFTNAGQIAASNDVTLNGRATLTFVGNNTLNSLTLNNNGGDAAPTVTPTGVLTLTSNTPVTATSSNAVATANITGGTLVLASGANAFDIAPIAIGSQTYTTIQPTLSITSIINGPSSSISKTGDGILQLSAQNTFNGLSVGGSSGGVLISGNSTPTQGGGGIASGPLGIGSVSMASGTELLVDGSRTIANNIAFAGTPMFDSTANTAWTLTLNGTLNGAGLAGTTPTIQVGNPFLTVALLGQIPNIASITSFNKTGPGILVFNSTGYTGDFNASALGNPNQVQLLNDGDGTGSVQNIALGNVVFDSGIVPNIVVNRAGGTLPFPSAANKIITPASISNIGTGLTVTNTNGYGLGVTGAVAFSGTPVYNVVNATNSNVTQGLYLSGNLTGVGFTKSGAGTMVINNATPASNTFTGNIIVTQGVVSVNADGQLGNSGNQIVLNPSTGTATLRATDTFTLAHTIQFAGTANARTIEVSNGKTLTIGSAFDLNAGAGNAAVLTKADQGTLVLNANNASWTGGINITQGAVLINNSALTTPAGTGLISVAPAAAAIGAALQLSGGVTVTNALNLQGTANQLYAGINFGGQLESVSGTNTYSGGIAMPFDATIGARAGSTLNITGLITATGTHRLQFNAEGDINVTGGETGALFGFDKYGAGTLTITSALFGGTITTGGVQVHRGTLVLSGAGTTNSNGAVNIVQSGAIMRLDNSGTNTNNRLTGRALTLQGGVLDFISNNTTELAGALIYDQGGSTLNNGGTGSSSLTFASFASAAGGTLNVTGTFGTATNFVKSTAAVTLTPATTGILNRVTTNGNEFATYNATNGIVPFTGYSAATNILSAATTSTFKATTSTLNSLTGNATLNALTLNNTAAVGGLGGNPPSALTLTSGSILANGTGGAFLNVPIVTFAANEAIIHVASGQTLTVNSGLNGTGGLSKNLAGGLILNTQQFVSGTTYVNAGTLTLSGGNNTLLFNNGVAVNNGGTLELNGNSQFMAGLSSAAAATGVGVVGGTVTNSSGTQATLTVNGNTNFGGVISGNIFLNKTGTGALNFQQPQTYSGPTLITGGAVNLTDFGTLPNTSQPIEIRYGQLNLTNNGGSFTDHGNRVNDAAPITLIGGQLAFTGRQASASSETFGAVTIAGGQNTLVNTVGGTNINWVDVTVASLTRTDNTATIRFNGTGVIGNSNRLFITANPTLTNNIIGAWAISDREFASYDANYGVGRLNDTGFAGYSGSGLNSNPQATDNVRFTTTGTTLMLANATMNTLTFSQTGTAIALNLGGNTLALQGGGLLFAQSNDNIDLAITNGSITSGTLNNASDFFIHHANYGGTGRTITIGAAITNNGTGAVRAIFGSGQQGETVATGALTLNGTNTYTGGTVINSGAITLGATGTLGSGGLTVKNGIFTQTAGGVIPSQALTLGGGASVTLAGNNSFTTLTIENNGGGAPTVNPTGIMTLTGVGGISVTTSSPGTIATIGTGTVDLNGNAAYPVSIGAAVVNGVDTAPWQAGLNITALLQNGGITKSGPGLLQLSSGLSTFAGGVNVTQGGLIIGASSNGANLGDTLVSGPLGTGAVTMAANTTVVSTGAFSVTNDFTFLGDTVFNGTNSLTLNGNTTLPATWNATVTAPQMVVTIGNVINSLVTDEINKSGLGTLNVGNYNGTINIAGGLIFNADGNTLGTPENLSLGGNVALTSDTAITVNRSGASPNARNKILQKVNLTNNGSILAVTNLNGYGLEFTGTTSLTGASHFSVTNASASNVIPGLTLSGVVSDTGGYSLVKSGLGTLLLTNSANTFGGAGATIDVLNGVLAASSDGALGNAANTITLDGDGTLGTAFRATGTFSSGRTFILNTANNAFEVTVGNVLTLTSPFSVPVVTNALIKNDNGVLAINAANPAMTGAVTINAGAIRAMNATALGSGTITIAGASGAALQLSGNVTVANPFTLTATSTGINTGGIIESVSGVNTYSGAITQTSGAAATFGAQAGATLNITGTYSAPGANSIAFAGAGNINLRTALNNGTSLNKLGNGTLTISVANPALAAAQTIGLFDGITVLAGAGTLGPVGTATGAVTVDVGATLTLDNRTAALGGTGSNVNDRFGTTRNITFRGGNFNLIGNETANTTETFAAPVMARGLSVITVTAQPGAQANLVFTSSSQSTGFAAAQNNSTGPTGTSVLFRGTNLGQAAGNGVATIKDTGATNGFQFNGQSGATGSNTKGILPWALIDATDSGSGTSFATGDGTAFTVANLRPLAAAEYGTANTITANQNVLLNGGTTTNIGANIAPNSLTIDASANIGSTNPYAQLSLSSGGILVRSGSTSTIGGAVINQPAGNSPLNIWTVGDLTISSTLIGGNGTANSAVGFVKAGAGTLTLSTPTTTTTGLAALTGLNTGINNYSGQLVINQGTLKLNGGTNTIQANNFMAINGGTLDLNGNIQQVLGLFTDGTVSGAGGIITSSSGTGNLIVNQDNAGRNWAGSIQNSVNFVRSGQSTLTIYSPQSFTGTTVINGGATTLRDEGSFSGTSAIDINFATLTLDNNTSTTDLADRVVDGAAITLRGGTLAFQGRAQTASSEQVGVVTLAQGNSFLNSVVGGTGINSAELRLAGLNRTTGGGTVNFTAATGGQIGNSARILISEINGASTATVGGGLVNEIIGGWAVIGTSDFATYVPGLGVAAMGSTGALQYSNLTSVPLSIATGAATDNISINVAVTGNTLSVPNDQAINSLRIGNIASQTVNIAAGKTLTLASGGLLFFSTAQQNIGSAVNQGSLTSGGSELFVYSQGTGPHVINSVITGSGMSLIKSGANTVTLAGTNTYTGGTVVNQGTLNVASTGIIPLATVPANGLVISGGTVTLNAAGSIAAGNIVTLNGGGSVLNLFGDNTIAGLVFNNIGGGASNVQVNTFVQPATGGVGTTGVLTIGSAGIVATSANVTNNNIIIGRVDFGLTMKTLDVSPITINGVQPAPLLASLALQGIVGSTGGINKTGNGVLQFNAQSHYTGPTQVTTGGIRTGVTNGGSRFSALTLDAGTHFNLNGVATTWGSLAGAGTVFNSSATANTLTVGFDNTSTTFSGQVARFSDAVVGSTALQKVGTGVMSMTSAQSFATGSTGAITINGGELNYTGAGKAFAGTAQTGGGTFNVNVGGTLRVNNSLASTSNVNNRLGLNVAGTLNLQGGSLIIEGNGNDASNTVETITSLDLTNGGGIITLNASAGSQLNLSVTTLTAEDGTGSGLIRGIAGTAAAAGNATLTITTPTLLGSQGSGATGTSTMPVRRDILADASATGVGTGFLVRDTVTGVYRALGGAAGLTSTEYNLTQATWASTQNAGINGTTTSIAVNRAANTLTAGGASTLNSALDAATFGPYGPNGGLLALSLTINAALALDGSVVNVNIGTLNGSAGTSWAIHTVGNGVMNLNGRFGLGNTGGIIKAGAGTLNFNNQTLFTGTLAVNDGTVNLNSGADNTLVVAPTAGAATTSALNVNGINAVVDLKGKNQAVAALSAVNPLPGNGGTVTNTGATAATLTSTGGGTFSGVVNGSLAFTRAGNNTTTLTNANTYTGATTVRGGSLQLRDSGSIASTAGLNLNYGTLNWDNFGLNPSGNPNPVRIAATNPVTMQGSAFTINGAGSTDTTVALNSVTITGGNNTFNVLPYINEGSTVKLTIGALTRDNTNHSGINFNGFTTNNAGTGVSSLGGQGLTQNGQVVINSVNQTIANGVTTAGSNIVTVPSTAGLYVGGLVTGTGLPANSRITAITSPTTFTITTGTGVTAQSSTTITAASPVINLSLTGAVTTANSATVTVPSTTGLFVGAPVTGTGIPANSFITAITSATTFTITTGTGVTAQAATTLTFNNLQNNLIGGWAVADGNTFATYVSGNGVFTNNGVSVMSQTTQGIVAPGFTGTDLSAALVTTGNYSEAGTTRTLAAGAQTVNSLRFVPGAAQTITMPTTSTLALNVGVITNAAFSTTLAATDATNTISGTGTDLYFYVNQNTVAIQPAIVGSAALISNGPATLSLRPQFASNTYTGGTFVQAGTLNLQAAGSFIAIPGNLTVTNAAVTMSTTPNQIAATSAVTINGGGTITLANYANAATQTLDSITFVNEGGAANPGLVYGTPTALSTIILSSATPLTATNNSLATTPTISTSAATLSALQFSNANPVITVNAGLGLTGLTIGVPITQNVGMTGPITKSGLGALDLSGQNTFTTGLILSQGSLLLGANSTPTTVGAAVTSGPLGTGTLTIVGGTTLLSDGTARTVSNAISVTGDFTVGGIIAGNGVILNGAVDLGATGRTITVTSPAVNATLAGVISSTATGTALTKAGAGTLTLSNATSNLGGAGVAVTNGILKLGVDNAIPNTSPLAISAGAGFDLNAFNLAIQSISGAGFITNSGAAKALVVGGTSATDVASTATNTFAGAIVAATPANLLLTKVGVGTLTLSGSNLSTYGGATTVVAGSLIGGADNAFSPNSIITVGNSTTGTANLTATLDTGAFNQTIAGLVAATQTAGSSSVINIASGKSLTVNGNMTFGSNTSATDVTNVNFTGGGDLVVSSTAGTIQVGGGTGSTNTNAATVNMSGLASFTASLGSTGVLRIGDVNSPTTGGSSTLTLAPVSVISGGTLNIGEATGQSNVQTLKLGSTSNALNFNTINVGTNTNRGAGNLSFATGTGTLTVRAFDGTGRAVMNLTNGAAGTAAELISTVNLVGHNADLLLSTLTLAARSAGTTGSATATFSFDTGTLDATTTVLTSRTGTTLTTGALASTLNIGGGTANLGAVTMAINTATTATAGTATATLNISGGNVTAGSINMASAVNTGAVKVSTSTINLTGGTLTMSGNITRTGGTGTENTTLTLNGGTLDMGGFNIGSATLIGSGSGSLNFQSGTLKNVGEINNGAAFNKTTAGTLILEGTNTYSGTTTITDGTLQVGSGGATGTLGTSTAPIANSGTLAFNRSNTIAVPNVISGTGAVTQMGSGTTQLTAVSTYTGVTTINAGALEVSTLADGGVDSSIGRSSNSAANLILNGGSLRYAGTGIGTGITNRSFTLGLGATAGTLDASGAAGSAMVFNNTAAPTYSGSGIRTLTLTGTNTDANTLAAPLGDSGGATSLVKNGSGTWVLTGDSNHTGTTTVNGGVLQVGAAGTGSISGPVQVNTPGTLAGSGSVGSTIIGSGAFLTPGDGNAAISNATLTFTAATLDAGSSTTLTITTAQKANSGHMSTILGGLADGSYNGSLGAGIADIIGAGGIGTYNTGTGGASHDLLNITGSFSITGGSGITVANNGYTGNTPAIGDIFNLVDFASANTTGFQVGTNFRSGGAGGGDLVLPDLSSFGLGWDVSAFTTYGIVVVVPEPSRALLLLFGLLGLCYRRRRSR